MDDKPVLKRGVFYWSDNARIVCRKCAGITALYTGRALSGMKLEPLTCYDKTQIRNAGYAVECECRNKQKKAPA